MRNRDTSAATAARVRAKHDRWVEELTEAGYFITKMGVSKDGFFERSTPAAGLQLYATNSLRETYRVTGWTGASEPILTGQDGDFVGLFSYFFTAGPR